MDFNDTPEEAAFRAEARAWLAAGPHRQAGEFVLVLGPGEPRHAGAAEALRVLGLLMEKLPAGEAARLAARITGIPRNDLYRASLGGGKRRGK